MPLGRSGGAVMRMGKTRICVDLCVDLCRESTPIFTGRGVGQPRGKRI